jgi:hypothetical protein
LVTTVAVVTVAGRISDAGDVTDVLLNGAPLALDRGAVSIGVPLVGGKNVIVVSAGDAAGNYQTNSISVNLDTTVPVPVVVVPAEPVEPDEDDEERSRAR